MQSNTEIKYIDSNGNNCSPLPIIETTITNANNLPLKSGIYRNTSSGFGTISYNNNVYLYNEVKQEVPDISSNGGIIIFQEAYVFMANIMPIIFKRFGYQSPLGTSISWSGWNYSIEGSSIVAGKLGTATKGSPTNPIYLMNGTPYISTSTVGSATQPIYMNDGTFTASSETVGSTRQAVYMNAGTITAADTLVGKSTTGNTVTIDNASVTCGAGAEIFNNYGSNIASGVNSHAEGSGNTASGDCSHAEGNGNTASALHCHAEGRQTEASGDNSHAEGRQTHATGYNAHAEGYQTYASGDYSHAAGNGTTANNYQYVVGKYNKDTTAPTSLSDTTASAGLFIVGIGTGTSDRKNGFRINPAGKVYGTGTYGTSGADYAEYFEWLDGNPDNEDRRGRFVALEGDKIRYVTSNDDYILGVVSADPSVAGDIHSEDWHNRYLKDIFGSKIVEVVEVEETTNEDGKIIPAHTERRWVLNPNYNPDAKYVSREERPEWAAIGIVGKLVVVDDGTCQVNEYCCPSIDGIATASKEKTNYRVMERLDDTHIRIFIR